MCFSMLLHLLTLLIAIFAKFGGASPNVAIEYLGISLGSLRNASLGISGHVWMANATAIQISDFSIEPHQKQELAFAFISEDGIELAKSIYKIVPQGNLGEDGLIPIKRRLNSGIEAKRLVIIVPRGTIGDWKRFGLVAGKSRKQLAIVPLNKAGTSAPEPFCCIQQQKDGEQSEGRGIIGDHYAASTGPISVEDSRTLVLHKFSLEANKAPDAWIFAGKGEVRQSTGKKARVLGRDTPARHCSLREFYGGNSDLRVRLAPGQDIYQIDYISMFCYQYDVDFGHISFHLNSTVNPVPAYIPEVLAASVPSQEEEKQLELLESNDLEGIC